MSLTPRQREVIARANEAGYFPTPEQAEEVEVEAELRIPIGSDGGAIAKIVDQTIREAMEMPGDFTLV